MACSTTRSTSGLVTIAPKRTLAKSWKSDTNTGSVVRLFAGRLSCTVFGVDTPSTAKVTVAVPATFDTFAIMMNVLTTGYSPASPSASAHVREVTVEPTEEWPSYQ